MQNYISEQVGHFLNRLRNENVTRNTIVEIPGYKDNQRELERQHEKSEAILQKLPAEEQQILSECMEMLEDMNSLEGQKAYCQGYVDCILLLGGLGLLRQDLSQEDIVKWIHQ